MAENFKTYTHKAVEQSISYARRAIKHNTTDGYNTYSTVLSCAVLCCVYMGCGRAPRGFSVMWTSYRNTSSKQLLNVYNVLKSCCRHSNATATHERRDESVVLWWCARQPHSYWSHIRSEHYMHAHNHYFGTAPPGVVMNLCRRGKCPWLQLPIGWKWKADVCGDELQMRWCWTSLHKLQSGRDGRR